MEGQNMEINKDSNLFEKRDELKGVIWCLIEQWLVPWGRLQDDIPFSDILNATKEYGSDNYNWFQLPKHVKNNIRDAYLLACTQSTLSHVLN